MIVGDIWHNQLWQWFDEEYQAAGRVGGISINVKTGIGGGGILDYTAISLSVLCLNSDTEPFVDNFGGILCCCLGRSVFYFSG